MIEYSKQILNNEYFNLVCNSTTNCNSFLFESSDNVFLNNFSLSFAKFLLCEGNDKKPCESCISCQKSNLLSHPDLIIYPKNKKSVLVDDVKNLIEQCYLSPIESNKKVFVFNNFSSANVQSQNKLLKILEEPPKNVFIILCVSNINKILPTIISRCKKFRLKPLSNLEVSNFLNLNSEDSVIAEMAQGSLEKALKYLSNRDFVNTFNNCMQALNMKNSQEVLYYSSLISSSKEIFEYSIEILESVFRNIILIRLNKTNLINNKYLYNKVAELAELYDCDCADKIIKKICLIKKQLNFNCNFVSLADSLLLYILEVRFYATKNRG